jgi:hypothetical protein
MNTIPTPPGPRAGAPSPTDPIVLESVVVRNVRLEHAAAGAADEPITFLAAVELEGELTISPLRVTLSESTRVGITWPEPLLLRHAAGVEREAELSPIARQQVNDAVVRHFLGDLGAMFS